MKNLENFFPHLKQIFILIQIFFVCVNFHFFPRRILLLFFVFCFGKSSKKKQKKSQREEKNHFNFFFLSRIYLSLLFDKQSDFKNFGFIC